MVLFLTKYAVLRQLKPQILTIRGQIKFSTGYIMVSCEEKGFYRVISAGQPSFVCRSYCGLSRRMEGLVSYLEIIARLICVSFNKCLISLAGRGFLCHVHRRNVFFFLLPVFLYLFTASARLFLSFSFVRSGKMLSKFSQIFTILRNSNLVPKLSLLCLQRPMEAKKREHGSEIE